MQWTVHSIQSTYDTVGTLYQVYSLVVVYEATCIGYCPITQHFLGVVDEVEGRRWSLRKECLHLMQKHIEQQLQRLQETSHSLHRRLHRRQSKARVRNC